MSRSQIVFETRWFRVESVAVGEAGKEPYYQVVQADGVIMLPVTEGGRIVLVRQFRPPLGRRTLEVPAGFMDEAEAPADAARRELYEETGYHGAEFTYLGTGRMLMNRLTSCEHMLLVTGARRDPAFEPRENIQVVELEPRELRQMILAGDFEQMSAFALLFLVQEKLGWRLF